MKLLLRGAIGLFALAGLAALCLRAWTHLSASSRIYTEAGQVPHRATAVVFGAGLYNGRPSAILYDRVASAVDLYKAGVVTQLLMSGDNRAENYNEPAAMQKLAQDLGVPASAITLDLAGYSTYDTCYRAKTAFGLSEVVLVTQAFHLDRAMMICDALGLRAIGFSADRRPYRSLWWSHLREIPATVNAMIEIRSQKSDIRYQISDWSLRARGV